MFRSAELRTLARLAGSLSRHGAALHAIGLSTRGRNTKAAELAGVSPRTMRRAARSLRQAGIRMPVAPQGRPPRTDYRSSRRGYRRRRGEQLDDVGRAIRALGRRHDEPQLRQLVRWMLEYWRERPDLTAGEAAHVLGVYLAAGGRLGPEAELYFRRHVPTLALDAAHTPWRAAVAQKHLAPWIAQRRKLERDDNERRIAEAREAAYRREAASERPTDAEFEEMRRRLRGRGS